MARLLMAGLIVVGLAVGVWVLWPKGDSDTTTTTPIPLAIATTTSLAVATTATLTTSRTTVPTSHVVTSVEEAEEILRELWFGWFEGIYNQDEERVREVVGSQPMLDAARTAFGAAFESAPTLDGTVLSDAEVLKSTDTCLATWGTLDVTAFRGSKAVTETVSVVRRLEDRWVLAGTWVHKDDLWEQDCDALLEPLS